MGNARLRAAGLIAVALLIAGSVFVASAWARSLAVSGITGHVLIGPLAPTRHTLPGLDGDEAPYAATIVVYDIDGSRELTRVRSDERGRFRIVLEPGLYLLRPLQQERPFPMAKSMRVSVERDAFTDVTVLYDIQIR
jgi:hypothetical protein